MAYFLWFHGTSYCTLGYSKKLENLKYAVALFIWHFNFWNVATNSMTCATYLKNDTGVASRYLTARNKGGTAFTYHSERFNARATHIRHCPREPRESGRAVCTAAHFTKPDRATWMFE